MITKVLAAAAVAGAIAIAWGTTLQQRSKAQLVFPLHCRWVEDPATHVFRLDCSNPCDQAEQPRIVAMSESIGIDHGPMRSMVAATLTINAVRFTDFTWEKDPADPKRSVLVSPPIGRIRLTVDMDTTRAGALLVRGPK